MVDDEDPAILSRIKSDTELSNFEAYVLELQLGLSEYKESCKNVRTGWEYIVTLLRQFIITQLILVMAVAVLTNEQLYLAFLSKCTNCDPSGISISASILMGFGAAFSLFVCFQSIRLFQNSQEFVNRARALENVYSVGTLKVHEGGASMPAFTYMEERLRKPPFSVQMNPVLQRVYVAACLMWSISLIIYIYIHVAPMM